jgi:hypothetical protein
MCDLSVGTAVFDNVKRQRNGSRAYHFLVDNGGPFGWYSQDKYRRQSQH